ncbi:hypothetical protein [Lysinibacillus boronitolerans]|uniref:Uncharacterized protein n=1 Tax=Lysinibacillus boronitolerans JCM 21713 = 10a = NBRC 103108 TaxID=1294264 RepID=A0ABR4Y477_9BACI|nr:hypothetical protein [Lysinibacillus boronitolerans]KGR88849.1 hypothetical protein CD31_02385 [Lysinibacillus boronitolerans JCM 21713 = 10a = NBRC 103108]
MTERNFNGLIVRHRKSAVFFERETDLNIEGYVSPRWSDQTPVIQLSELRRKYHFSKDDFNEFLAYMEQIANEAWKNFTPKEADSMGADYDSYYDKEFDNEGSLSIGKYYIDLDGPFCQPKTNNPVIRLFKFNKRKFESFIYDLRKALEDRAHE